MTDVYKRQRGLSSNILVIGIQRRGLVWCGTVRIGVGMTDDTRDRLLMAVVAVLQQVVMKQYHVPGMTEDDKRLAFLRSKQVKMTERDRQLLWLDEVRETSQRGVGTPMQWWRK